MTLSPRETEVIELVAAGLLDKEIARELGIARQTVKNYVTSVRARWDLNGTRTAVAVKWLLDEATTEQMDRVWARLDAIGKDA